eukprot:TRINITY_DN5939_c0_g1_i2.p1 TRINITY_DN5939_c0_g1~~TRINITY_DN5939_c0_g1_i2.p1  ORF type:complete len:147 (+),score=26.96 TRINITY_DN5939_c0_g1_i2:49-441(+)
MDNENQFCLDVMNVLTGNAPIPNGNENEIRITDRSITVYPNQRKEAAHYIRDVVKQLGYDKVELQTWNTQRAVYWGPKKGEKVDIEFCNVVVTIPGTELENTEYIVLGAHYGMCQTVLLSRLTDLTTTTF